MSKSATYAAILAEYFGVDEIPFDNRSDDWWSEFWTVMGMREARRIKEFKK